jgi:multimeric flavodoxin WrbA
MNKHILILSSSPRTGGNSDILCDEFSCGTIDARHIAEKIGLSEMKIGYCTGCGACHGRSKSCPQKDDMDVILEKMAATNVIVLATPEYFYTMCVQIKTLIDRSVAGCTKLRGKEF